MNNGAYQIKTNKNGRRILVLNQLVDIEKEDDIAFDDFDAIFLNISFFSQYEVLFFLQRISPFYSDKCWIKPRFYATQMNEIPLRMDYLIDGYADDFSDDTLAKRVEEIYENIGKLKIVHHKDDFQHTHVALCLRLCRYSFARGFFDFTVTVVPGMARGFTALFTILFDKLGMNTRIEILSFVQKLLTMNYVRKKKFEERVHLCPDCHSSHLLFIEGCPKCQSSHLTEESVIHHFRCANVSPESTYSYDGELRCPKCKKFLRHIGVDYDRPADVYRCHNCDNTFLHAAMKVYCPKCNKYYKAGDLYPFDIWEFEFTEEGIQNLVAPNVKLKLAQDIWNGYMEYESYIELFDWFLGTLAKNESVIVLRIHLVNMDMGREDREALFEDIYVRFYYYNLTQKGDYIYLTQRCRSENAGANSVKMEMDARANILIFLQRYGSKTLLEEQMFTYNAGDDADAFIKKVDRTSE